VANYKRVTSGKIDAEIDFNKLVLNQMNRCNEALTEGKDQFLTAVIGFSCILSHLKQRDKTYHQEMKFIKNQEREDIENAKRNSILIKDIKYDNSIKEYEVLVRLCSRHNLFPAKRGALNTDEDD